MRPHVSCTMLSLAIGLQIAGCDGASPGEPDRPGDGAAPDALAVDPVWEGLDEPVHLTAPAGEDRVYIVERAGRILVAEGDRLRDEAFLDIRSQVSTGGERGLLSLAFHPDYPADPRFYVNFTDLEGDTRVVEFSTGPSGEDVDPEAGRTVLQIPQPYDNHNGGQIAFGPDGMLYVGMGDGGSGGDPHGNGQDPETLLGALLRIDIHGQGPYEIPEDNPYAGGDGGRGEIWAIGLRNPWRFSFDRTEETLYLADVGQNRSEEVNAQPAREGGRNYGWNVVEGEECFETPDCDVEAFTLPVVTYRTGPEGCAVVGGFVYRGEAIPALEGHYLYSDWCGGWLRSFRLEDGQPVAQREWEVRDLGRVLSFGEDAAGEVYILSSTAGTVYRIVPGD